jgi:hypothetical protein
MLMNESDRHCTNCHYWDLRYYGHCLLGTMPVAYDNQGVAMRADPDKDCCDNWQPKLNEPLKAGG